MPESIFGLAMRKVELLHIKTKMPFSIFEKTSFLEELENTELILLGFDQNKVADLVESWSQRIASGSHMVIDFELLDNNKN
ncbi:UNVERIFIED_ORG: hypothetical protein HNP28_003223 [Comamonas terrigena]